MTKTTRVMLAVLAACGASAAMAQSSVNLYGRVNTVIENEKIGNASTITKMNSSSSYIGFKGVEDLGNGLKAGFVLESSFQSDTGAGPLSFARQSEVYLGGNFGTLRLGAFDPASYYATADYISMHNHDTGSSADQLYVLNGSATNKIAYVTPNFGGFSGEVQYGFGEKAGYGNLSSEEVRGAWDLALNYENGPFGVGFGYSTEKFKDNGGFGVKSSADQAAIRVSYAIGDLTLGAYYQKAQEKYAAEKAKYDTYRIAAKYVIGASELHANVGQAGKVKFNGVSVPNSGATQWTLAYNYNLSKRTKVYAFYTNLNNTNSGFGAADDSLTSGDLIVKEKKRSFAVGVRHLF